ncbi:TniB family NTP-binding protein [Deinococcus oregonensis]|uniref:TniB family NTP-binding protein n=1 Tax=Deinococcus oregonensis TaxID=1805970 RepID=A0ABV6B254_9DEIO
MIDPHHESAPSPLTFDTWQEWREFVALPAPIKPVKPKKIEMDELARDPEKLRAFNRQRIDYHNSFGPIFTPDMEYVHSIFLPIIRANVVGPPGARLGGVIDGDGTIGKTTIVASLGRTYEIEMKREYPDEYTRKGDIFLPVAYVTLRGATTVKGFSTQLARYFSTPYRKGADADEITDLVVENAKRCATSLILVDDIHYLKNRTKTGQDVNNHLKYLINRIPATFIFCGIGVKDNEFFSEGFSKAMSRKSQTRRRFVHVPLYTFKQDTQSPEPTESQTLKLQPQTQSTKPGGWDDLLQLFEKNLILGKRTEGMLIKHRDYIYRRTGGYMGALTRLIRTSANLAITDPAGGETITKQLMNKVMLDVGAEEDFSKVAEDEHE